MRIHFLTLTVVMSILLLAGCTSTSTVRPDWAGNGGTMMIYVNPVREQYEYLKGNFSGYNPFLLYGNIEDIEMYVRYLLERNALPYIPKAEHEPMIVDMEEDWFIHLYPTSEKIDGYITDSIHETPTAYFIINKETGALTHYATQHSSD